MAKGRTNPGDVANLMVRCLLADASELLGGWTDADRERTLRYFGNCCAYTGAPYDASTSGRWSASPRSPTSSTTSVRSRSTAKAIGRARGW